MEFRIPDKDDLHYEMMDYQIKYLADGQVDIQNLLYSFQNLAFSHAEKLNVGKTFLEDNHSNYIVLRHKGYFLKEIKAGEKLRYITFPTADSPLQLYRYSYLVNENGEPVFYLISLFVLMDITTRKIRVARDFKNRIKEKLQDIESVQPLTEERLSNFAMDDYSFAFDFSYTVQEEDLDENGHMNNSIYFKMIHPLTKDIKIKSFEIDYERECLRDEKILISHNQKDPELIIKGEKEDSSLSFKVKIIF